MYIVLSCLGLAVIFKTTYIMYFKIWQFKCFRLELLRLMTWTSSLCIWPILWTHIATPETCITCSKAGLIWPYLLIIVDMFIYTKDMRPSVNIELSTTTSFAFTIAGMLGAISDPIRSRFFIAAILMNIMIAFPTISFPDEESKLVLETFQKSVVVMACGLIITGILYKKPKFNLC